MEWFKKHSDALMVIATIIGSMLWMNGKFNEVDRQFAAVEKEITIIKTVLLLKNILPAELAQKEKED